MKKQKLMIVMSLLCVLTLVGTMIVPTLQARSSAESATAQSDMQGGILDVLERMRQAQAQQLEGSWTTVATPTLPPGAPPLPPATAYLTTISRFRFPPLNPSPSARKCWTNTSAFIRPPTLP